MLNAKLLARTQYGCRFLQGQVERYSDLRSIVFDVLRKEFFELMIDPFGNYLA